MPANGDSSITQTFYKLGTMQKVVIDIVADSGDGSVTATALTTGKLDGYLIAIETNPGATAPTDNYDITLPDSDGIDVLQGLGANRDTANSEYATILIAGTNSDFHPPLCQDEAYTLTVANNSVNSAILKIVLFYSTVI